MFIEYLNEAAHVGTLEIMGQIGIQVYQRGCVLQRISPVQDRDGITQTLYTDLLDRYTAFILHALNVGHLAAAVHAWPAVRSADSTVL